MGNASRDRKREGVEGEGVWAKEQERDSDRDSQRTSALQGEPPGAPRGYDSDRALRSRSGDETGAPSHGIR